MPRPLRVFLCHASQDKPAVRELYNALKAEGWIDPWLDKTKILPGQDWELVIEKAVDAADVVIVCLSSRSVTKEGYVQREIRYAYDIALEKPEETIFLIPVRLDNCEAPRKLRRLHRTDYFGSDKKNSFSDLLEALRIRYEQKMRLEAEESEQEMSTREPKEKAEAEREERSRRQKKLIKAITPYRVFAFSGLVVIGLLLFLLRGNFLPNNLSKTETPTKVITMTSKPAASPTLTYTSSVTPEHPKPTATQLHPTSMPAFPSSAVIGSTAVGSDGMVMVYVPAGTFTMGNDKVTVSEQPAHQVLLEAFWIDKTEVTNAMYAKCVDQNQCDPPKNLSSSTHSSYFGNPELNNYPVINVNWNMARDYCEWAGGRLPTEAEWEKAARGTDGRPLPWGSAAASYKLLNFWASNLNDATEVGKYPKGASVYGALDMAGNVEEWVSSLYQPYPYNAHDGRESLTASGYRVTRGGSWYDVGTWVRSDHRGTQEPTQHSIYLGFRCTLSQ